VRFARGAGGGARGVRTFRRAAGALVLCCLVLAVAQATGVWLTVALLVLATVLLTAGELWQSITGWEVPVRYAPDGRRGEYLAVFSLGVTAQNILGPVLLTALIVLGTAGWVVLAALFVAAAALIGPATAALERHRAPAPQSSTTVRSST
jgi:dipeptide/tripeptide permease